MSLGRHTLTRALSCACKTRMQISSAKHALPDAKLATPVRQTTETLWAPMHWSTWPASPLTARTCEGLQLHEGGGRQEHAAPPHPRAVPDRSVLRQRSAPVQGHVNQPLALHAPQYDGAVAFLHLQQGSQL